MPTIYINPYIHGGAAGASTTLYTVTTTGAQTHNIASLGVSAATTVYWGDGNSDIYTGTAARSHAYAGAGTWVVSVDEPLYVTTLNLNDNKITLNSADVAAMANVIDFRVYSLKAGTFDSADVSAWQPAYFYLYSMPTGYAGTFDSADVSAWRPAYFYLHSMPAGYAITAGGGFANWSTTVNFYVQNNGLTAGTVDAILWELYQASTVPRTASGGTINISDSNAAPSGTYQAATSCPVTVATPGKEIAHELKNDGCAVGFNKWTTVTTS